MTSDSIPPVLPSEGLDSSIVGVVGDIATGLRGPAEELANALPCVRGRMSSGDSVEESPIESELVSSLVPRPQGSNDRKKIESFRRSDCTLRNWQIDHFKKLEDGMRANPLSSQYHPLFLLAV